jgi:fructokinase
VNHPSALPQFVAAGEALTDLIRSDGDRWVSQTGGSTWNVARAMASLGVATGFAGAISCDWFGDALFAASRAGGLDLRFLQRVARSPLLAIVYQTAPPQYSFIGDNSADLAFDPAKLPANWQTAAKWVHFGGISLARAPLAGTLIALAEELKQAGVRISYDPNFRNLMTAEYDPVLKRMAQLADVIKVSDEDLCGLFRIDSRQAAREGGLGERLGSGLDTALDTLRSFNPDAAVLLTLGARGATMLVGRRQWHAAPPHVEVIDTVGAGDAGVAGLIYALIRESAEGLSFQERNWSDHLQFSVASGTAACLNAGAVPPQLAQVESLLKDLR